MEKMRILIAPHEICGQMQILARTFRAMGHDALAVSYSLPEKTGQTYSNDLDLQITNGNRILRLMRAIKFFIFAARRFDIFHFFYGRSLIPYFFWDLPLLKMMGKVIVIHFRGTDLISRKPIYKVGRDNITYTREQAALNKNAQRELPIWRKYADLILVSEPDLKWLVPEAVMSQQVIDLDDPDVAYRPLPLKEGPVRILHAPTSREKKGTSFVLSAIDELKRRGLNIELVLVEDMMPKDAKQIYKTCHIGIDQVLLGWYGNFSIEMMAMGRPVVCYINPELNAERPDLPIINTTHASLADVLQELVTSPQKWEALGRAGREYVEKYHDAKMTAKQLIGFYDSIMRKRRGHG